jgi:predicted membrane protein (TIGR00267 family)
MTASFIRGFLDGSLSSLGIVVGASSASSWIIIAAATGGAIGNSMSNFLGALASAGSQEYEDLRRIEKAMVVADLKKSVLFRGIQKRAALVGTVDGLATLGGGLLPIIPYLFAPAFTALLISVSVVTASVFAIGLYLGAVSRQSLILSALKMAGFALIISVTVYLVQRLIVPPGIVL